jgi:hypothetical protein
MPRQGEILVATWLAKLSFQLLLSLRERWLMTISGGSISCQSGLGKGKNHYLMAVSNPLEFLRISYV